MVPFFEAAVCLAMNMFYEARSESGLGQFYVATVTLNRVQSKRYPDNVCDVVWQNKQFSWTHDGKPDDPNDPIHSESERELYRAMLRASFSIMRNPEMYMFHDVTHYHTVDVMPFWAKGKTPFTQVGKHLFYKDIK